MGRLGTAQNEPWQRPLGFPRSAPPLGVPSVVRTPTGRRLGGYLITFPDFDWGISQGDAEEDSRLRGRKYRLIRLPAMQAATAELYRQFRASGLRKIDLASRMGIPKTVVDRLFDLDHHTRMNQIEAAFEALGKRIGIVVENAA